MTAAATPAPGVNLSGLPSGWNWSGPNAPVLTNPGYAQSGMDPTTGKYLEAPNYQAENYRGYGVLGHLTGPNGESMSLVDTGPVGNNQSVWVGNQGLNSAPSWLSSVSPNARFSTPEAFQNWDMANRTNKSSGFLGDLASSVRGFIGPGSPVLPLALAIAAGGAMGGGLQAALGGAPVGVNAAINPATAEVGSPASDVLVGDFAGAPATAGSLAAAPLGSPASDVFLSSSTSPLAESLAAGTGIPSTLDSALGIAPASTVGRALASPAVFPELPATTGTYAPVTSATVAPVSPAAAESEIASGVPPSLVGAVTGASSGAGGGFLDSVWNEVKKNPALLLSGGGMLASALMQPKVPALQGVPQMNSNAEQQAAAAQGLISEGQSLLPSETTGQLPPGEYNALQSELNANIEAIKSKYASMGMSGSTPEQQDIAGAHTQAANLVAQLAQQATQTGANLVSSGESGLGASNSTFNMLASLQLQNDQALQQALANFAAASAGGYSIAQLLKQHASAPLG